MAEATAAGILAAAEAAGDPMPSGPRGDATMAAVAAWQKRHPDYSSTFISEQQKERQALRFPTSEQGDAEAFADRFAATVRFDHRRETYLIADQTSGLWLPDRMEQARNLAVDTIRDRQEQATHITNGNVRKHYMKWARNGESRTRISNMLFEARKLAPLAETGDEWDLHPYLLGCKNGVVDLRTGQLRRALPEERVSLSTGIDYDPEARSELWEHTLAEIFPHEGLVAFVQRALGYTATGDISLDKWFMAHGGGRNGKGVLYNAVRAALRDYALELPASVIDSHASNAYDLANLPGRRFVTSSESGGSIRLNADLIKKLSGGDRQRAANKYEKSVEFDPMCKLWLACNNQPQVDDDSDGFWARVIVIPFTESFLGRENTTLRRTLTEPPQVQAVLAWLVQGAQQVLAAGALGEIPAIVRRATADFRYESGPLADFLDEVCVLDARAQVKASELRGAYERWTERRHVRRPLNHTQFGQAIKARFDHKDRADGAWYQGLGLRAQTSDEPRSAGDLF